jgi:uncharacterized protein YbgA (DUF1722 family)
MTRKSKIDKTDQLMAYAVPRVEQFASDDISDELLPLIVPVTLLKHYVRKYKQDYLLGQLYLEPHPKELMIRNHV